MMVDNFLTSPPAYEAMNTDFMVLAIYQSILGTPAGSLGPVNYSDWNSALKAFRLTEEQNGGGPNGLYWAAYGLTNTLLHSTTFATELTSVILPTCTGIGTSSGALSVTALYLNTLGAPPSCAQLSDGLTATANGNYTYPFLANDIWTSATSNGVWPTSVSFVAETGHTSSLTPQIVMFNTSGSSGSWMASITYNSTQTGWISVPQFGDGPGASISVNPTGLLAGIYTGTVSFTTAKGSEAVSVTLLVTSGTPVIYENEGIFILSGASGWGPYYGGVTSGTFQILASDGSSIPITASTSTTWLSLNGVASGSTPASVSFSVNPASILANGMYFGTINISAPTAANSTLAVPVIFTVSNSTRNFTNPAFQNTTNGLFTDLMYFTILGRDPDPGGFDFWLNIVNSGGPGVYFLPSGGTPPAVRTAIEGSGAPNEGFVGSPEFLGLFK